MHRFFIIYLGFFFLSAPLAALGEPAQFTLSNGLRVVVSPGQRVPVVVVGIWYRVGSAEEAPFESGIAHFLEHMMFQGTATSGPGEFKYELASLGGNTNAATTYDYTYYTNIVPKKNLARVLEMEADRMVNLQIVPSIFDNEMKVVLEERLSRLENNPDGMAQESILAHFFINHPYRIPVLGWRSEIETTTPKAIMDFYHKWYGPNNAILVLSGDITLVEAQQLTKKYFGKIAKKNLPKRRRAKDPPLPLGTQKLTYFHPELGNEISLVYATKSVHMSWQNYYTAKMLLWILEKNLHTLLTDTLDLIGELEVTIERTVDPWPIGIALAVKSSHHIQKVMASVENYIEALKKNGISAADVVQAKEAARAALYAQDSDLYEQTVHFGAALALGDDFQGIKGLPEFIGTISVEDLNQALNKLFRRSPNLIIEKLHGEHPL